MKWLIKLHNTKVYGMINYHHASYQIPLSKVELSKFKHGIIVDARWTKHSIFEIVYQEHMLENITFQCEQYSGQQSFFNDVSWVGHFISETLKEKCLCVMQKCNLVFFHFFFSW